jgi:nucleolar protein 53
MAKSKRHRLGNSGKVETKKKWKKVDVQDVEEAMEDDRITRKLAKKMDMGGVVSEELFTIDTAGDLGKEKPTGASKKSAAQKKIASWKIPRVGRSANEIAKIERAEAGTQMRESTQRKLKAQIDNANSPFDVWAADSSAVAPKTKRHLPSANGHLEKRPVKVPKTMGKRISDAPAIVAAHEGQSINPAPEAFSNLEEKIVAQELEKQFQEQALDRKLKPVTHTLRELADPKELEGLDEQGKLALFRKLTLGEEKAEIKDDENDQAADGSVSVGKNGVLQKRKTQAERNKEKRRKLREQQQKKEAQEKKLGKSVGAIGSMLKDMKSKAEKTKSKAALKEETKSKEKELEKKGIIKKMKIGRIYYEEKGADIGGVEDGKKGLRAAPLQTLAIQDRMNSVFRRGMLQQPPAATKLQMHRIKKHTRARVVRRKFISPLLKGENNLLI